MRKLLAVSILAVILVGCSTRHDDGFNYGHKIIRLGEETR